MSRLLWLCVGALQGRAGAIVLSPPAFLSGGLAGALSHTVLVPVDVVKTRQQNQPERYSGGLMESAGVIIATDGPAGLLAGSGPTLVGYFVHAGVDANADANSVSILTLI